MENRSCSFHYLSKEESAWKEQERHPPALRAVRRHHHQTISLATKHGLAAALHFREAGVAAIGAAGWPCKRAAHRACGPCHGWGLDRKAVEGPCGVRRYLCLPPPPQGRCRGRFRGV